MKAVLCKAWGPPESLVVEDVATPEPGPGEIVIAVKAVGLNFFDTLIIAGKYQYKPDLPFSPGAEIAGVVSAVGRHVSGFAEGDRVMSHLYWGGCREAIAVAAEKVVPMPEGIGFEAAAGLTVTYGTTLHALRDRGHLKPGETLVVLGAAGGVGQAAIEIGKVMGAKVIACASSDEKLEFCRRIGADETVNYTTQDLKLALKELSGGKGVDVVYDPVGGDLSEQALRALGWNGRLLVVGFAAGDIPAFRSTSCCSRAARSSACSGAITAAASPSATAPTWPRCSPGARLARSRRTSTAPTSSRRPPPPSRPSPGARSSARPSSPPEGPEPPALTPSPLPP
jgi:NADPH:quinone reductase